MEKFVYQGTILALEVAEAIRKVNLSLSQRYGNTIKLKYEGYPSHLKSWEDVNSDPGLTRMPAHASMRMTGREVKVWLESDQHEEDSMVPTLWSAMVPNGFVPWNRYPVPSETQRLFHYFGDWQSIGDSLQGEGRGEHSWPSICVASQIEAGVWEGGKDIERSVQANLHRLGIPCGPLDGNIGERTLGAIKSLGLSRMQMSAVNQALMSMSKPKKEDNKKRFGQLFIESTDMRVFTSGSVASQKTRTGFVLSAWGPGILNVVLD